MHYFLEYLQTNYNDLFTRLSEFKWYLNYRDFLKSKLGFYFNHNAKDSLEKLINHIIESNSLREIETIVEKYLKQQKVKESIIIDLTKQIINTKKQLIDKDIMYEKTFVYDDDFNTVYNCFNEKEFSNAKQHVVLSIYHHTNLHQDKKQEWIIAILK